MKLDKSYKVRVNPEQSREIHSLLGFCSANDRVRYKFLFIDEKERITYSNADDLYVIQKDYTEITAPELIALLSQDEAIQATDSLDSTPKPEFKVRDRVYDLSSKTGRIFMLSQTDDNRIISLYPVMIANTGRCFTINGEKHLGEFSVIFHATPENHEMLCKLYPHIEFEKPPVILQGIKLAKSLIKKGHKFVLVDTVIGIRVLHLLKGNTLYDVNDIRLDELDDITPLDPKTGKPLTNEVLDD